MSMVSRIFAMGERERLVGELISRFENHSILCSRLVLCFRQKTDQRHGIEVEHLATGEPTLVDLIYAQHRPIKSVSRWSHSPLPPQHDHLLFACSYDAWIHRSFRLGRLQRAPRFAPGWTLRLRTA